MKGKKKNLWVTDVVSTVLGEETGCFDEAAAVARKFSTVGFGRTSMISKEESLINGRWSMTIIKINDDDEMILDCVFVILFGLYF